MRKTPKLPMIITITFLSIISVFTISCSKTTLNGDHISIGTKDGSKIALVSQEADKMIIIDTAKISVP